MAEQQPQASQPSHAGAPLFRTLAGRAIVVSVGIKLLVAALRATLGSIPALGVVDSVAGFAIATGAAYFLVQLFLLAKRRLLWRVRRKLILSYVLIGVVPAILIAAFFLLGALLLFFNFSSYLVQTEVRSLTDRVRLLATGAALEIQRAGGRDVRSLVNQMQSRAEPEFSGLSMAVVRIARTCSTSPQTSSLSSQGSSGPSPLNVESPALLAGPWAHVTAPTSVPEWIECQGFAGLMSYSHREVSGEVTDAFVRAVAFPDSPAPGFAVIVDRPIDGALKERLRMNTGVDIRSAEPVDVDGGGARPVEGRPGAVQREAAAAGPPASGPLSWVTFLEYRDWSRGTTGTLLLSTQLNIRDIYARLSAAPGVVGNRPFGQALLLVLLVVVGGLFLIIEAVALIVGSALARSITGSVHELFEGTERVRQGDFSHKIAITANDQLGELAGSFNSMTASIEDLLRQAAEKKRLEEELRIAHEIQMSLLPQAPLVMPGLSATALCIPAREVGGDYYDFLPLDDHRVGILIADVSGKGTSAALYMAQLKGLVLSLSRIHSSPRALLVNANRILARHLDARSFITMTYAVVDVKSRTMTYARAGHVPLIHVAGGPAGMREARLLTPNGMVVGLKLDGGEMFERLLEEQTIALRGGDLYVFFTDGISEAMNGANDVFGEARLKALVENLANLPSDELRERVLREVRAFVNGAPQHDDMTMILVRVEELPPLQVATTENAEHHTSDPARTAVSSAAES